MTLRAKVSSSTARRAPTSRAPARRRSYRLAKLAQAAIEGSGAEVDFLDLSVLVSEYGRVIYKCKACVSTAQPLCHWPCSCYPNHALGQTQDWMNELYPRWVAAHGVLIITR
jgi:multimeric flavodoxin WrbA